MGRGPSRPCCIATPAGLSWRAAPVALGCYIGFTGIVTFKNSAALRAIAAELPADRFLSRPMRRISRRCHIAANATSRPMCRGRQDAGRGARRFVRGHRHQTTDNFFKLFSKVPRAAAAAA